MDSDWQLVKVEQDFEVKVSLAVLSAHSSPESVYLGEGDDDRQCVDQREYC